jgi:hypothetical protein
MTNITEKVSILSIWYKLKDEFSNGCCNMVTLFVLFYIFIRIVFLIKLNGYNSDINHLQQEHNLIFFFLVAAKHKFQTFYIELPH